MSVNLQKGQRVNLQKEGGGTLRSVRIGLGWDAAGGNKGLFSLKPKNIDCDASVFVCKNGRLSDQKDVVYFGNLRHSSGSVIHMGDNLTGDGEGDDEQITVNLLDVPSDYDKLVFVVNIYKCRERNQHFGMIKNAFIRICDNDNGVELCKYNLSENYDNMTAMIFGEIYRKDGVWKFSAMGQATTDSSITELAKRYT